VRLVWIEKLFHGNLDARRYVLKLTVVDPVFSCISGEWKVLNSVLVDVVVKLQQQTEGCLSKGGMRRVGNNVITRKVLPRGGEAIGGQELLYGKVRKLDDLGTANVNDTDEIGAD
jgi:hypothetical protein